VLKCKVGIMCKCRCWNVAIIGNISISCGQVQIKTVSFIKSEFMYSINRVNFQFLKW
jgi:phosphomevalonate kinase